MAKAYILNIKDTSGNWVGIPTLIGQKGEKGLNGAKGVDGVGITNITQQDKKLIIDLSNNTRKEFTIPSADLPNGVDILNKITREVPTNSPSITNFKNHLNIPSITDIKTVKDLSFVDNKLKLTMNDESSKEVTIKSGGIKKTQLFKGSMPIESDTNNIFTVNNIDWNILYIKTSKLSYNYTVTYIFIKNDTDIYMFENESNSIQFSILNNQFNIKFHNGSVDSFLLQEAYVL